MPDPLDTYGTGDGPIRWSIAVLLVAWPVWALTSLNLARDAERDRASAARPSAAG